MRRPVIFEALSAFVRVRIVTSTVCSNGRLPLFLRVPSGIVKERGMRMTGFEIISIVIAIISLLISAIALVLKLFAFLDNRYKRK